MKNTEQLYVGLSLCSDLIVEPDCDLYLRQPVVFSLRERGDYVATKAINFGGYTIDIVAEGFFISDSLYGGRVLPFRGNCPIFIPALHFRQFPLGLYVLSGKFLNTLWGKDNVMV